MSYDLFFDAESGKKINAKSFAAYFTERANYRVENGPAWYGNEDTGVYFIFDEPADGVMAFNLNYFRPHVFGLEAAVELEKFGAAFGMSVHDEQEDGPEGPFARERFLRGWNEGNRLAYRAMLKEQTEPVLTWPAKRIQETWEWNFGRPPEQERVGENLFVPAIFAVELEGEVKSVAIWPPECSILLPAVDAVLLPCEQKGKGSEELALVEWAEVSASVSGYQVPGTGLARFRLEFEQWPPEMAAFLAKRREAVGELKGVGLDTILDQELVEEAGGG